MSHANDDTIDDLYILELDPRFEFGAAIIDSDLDADDNSGCSNSSCTFAHNDSCINTMNC